MKKIENSQVATGGSRISNSNNNNKDTVIDINSSIKKIQRKSVIIGFISGIVASIISSYLYDYFFK